MVDARSACSPTSRARRSGSGPSPTARRAGAGATFTITIEDVDGTAERARPPQGPAQDVTAGDKILIDDGRLVPRGHRGHRHRVITEVVVGGVVSNNKGINLPGVAVSVPALTEKDSEDLRLALRHGVDMVALSFVRTAADVETCTRSWTRTARRVPVIAKIEKPQAVENLDEIIDAFDAIMVARGDLGVELPLEEVPLVQKRIVTPPAAGQAGDRGDPDAGVDDHRARGRPAPRPPTWPTRSWTARTR